MLRKSEVVIFIRAGSSPRPLHFHPIEARCLIHALDDCADCAKQNGMDNTVRANRLALHGAAGVPIHLR